jgi:hypothetical protein
VPAVLHYQGLRPTIGTQCRLVSHALNCCWVVQVGTAAYCLAISHLITHPRDAQGAIAAATGWLQLQQQQQQQAGLSRALRTVLGWLDQAQAAGPGPKVYSNMGYMRWGFVHAFRWGAAGCCACTEVGCCGVLWGCVHAIRWGAVGCCACSGVLWGAVGLCACIQVGCCGALCMHSSGVLCHGICLCRTHLWLGCVCKVRPTLAGLRLSHQLYGYTYA